MIKKFCSVLIFCAVLGIILQADIPDWVERLPFTDDAFWGVGNAATVEEAELLAKREILMQMSSRVKAAIAMNTNSSANRDQVSEDLDRFFIHNSLRGAERMETYEEEHRLWVLLKYCEECGRGLLKSALNRYEEIFSYNSEQMIDTISDEKVMRGFMVERRLQELQLDDFQADDIIVRFEQMRIIIMIVNFMPYEVTLSPSQQQGLTALSDSLLEELTLLDYSTINIVGYANPTGERGESLDLEKLSRMRAETMAGYLAEAGLQIGSVTWRGGTDTIGDVATEKGKGLNRRVEIVVDFK